MPEAGINRRKSLSRTPTRNDRSLRGQSKSPSDRPKSSASTTSDGSVVFGVKRKKKKWAAKLEDAHVVEFTVTICAALPIHNSDLDPDDDEAKMSKLKKKKKKVVDAPRAQNYYHTEYTLLPDDEDSVKTDIVTFGPMAAKLYTERQDPKVLKCWQEADRLWVAWSHMHAIPMTDELLTKLISHQMELKVWDIREKCSTRARFDRPKAFRLPSGKDEGPMSGVQGLVLRQSKAFIAHQPKRAYINRPLPTYDNDDNETLPKHQSKNIKKDNNKSDDKINDNQAEPSTPSVPKDAPILQQPMRSYSRLGRLAESDLNPRQSPVSGQRSSYAKKNRPFSSANISDQGTSNAGDADFGLKSHKAKKNKKHEEEAESLKKNGVCCVTMNMASFFGGVTSKTVRLEEPVWSVDDLLVTVTMNGDLMSVEQKQRLNPLTIQVQCASDMPNTPLSYADLKLKCLPAYVKYNFFGQGEHCSISREQDKAIYWEDTQVVLAGLLDQSELRQYLSGPPMEIEVHDRDRVETHVELKPTLFGDDLEDEKISSVGVVSGKRTLYNPFKGRGIAWDPYGIAKVNMAGLLLGQQIIHITTPIQVGPTPDPLGLDENRASSKLIGVAGAIDGPEAVPLPTGHYLQSGACLKVKVEVAHSLAVDVSNNENPSATYKRAATKSGIRCYHRIPCNGWHCTSHGIRRVDDQFNITSVDNFTKKRRPGS